jgi:hypothetical protein
MAAKLINLIHVHSVYISISRRVIDTNRPYPRCHGQDLETAYLIRNDLASRTRVPVLPVGTAHLPLQGGRVRVDGNEIGTTTIDDEVIGSTEIGRKNMLGTGSGATGRDTRTIGTGRAVMTTGIGIGADDTTPTIGTRETQVVETVIGKGNGRGTIMIEGPG